MSSPHRDALVEEVELSRKAKLANESFIAPYLASKRKTLYENFCEASIVDKDVLLEIKRMNNVLDDIEDEINTIINTGKMAAHELADTED